MASDRLVIANLDFDDVKKDLIDHFKSREEFSDYEFTGSSLNLLMDILSYNTHYYSLASNFLLNESFIDSALLRKNVVSLAKRLNYTPRSVSSAFTTVTLSVTKADGETSYILPAGTLFNSTSGNATLSFYTMEDYAVQFESTDVDGSVKTINVIIYEGKYTTQRFSGDKNYTDFSSFTLNDDGIDTSTLVISVNGTQYFKVTPEDEKLFDLNEDSNSYFIEENRDGHVNIIFGNGIVGKPIQYGDQIFATYLRSSGEDGNGISVFSCSNQLWSVTSVKGITQGGAPKETIQSIKDNAPKWFQAQYRAVTTNDYEVILRNKFADIQAISVYGGEDVPGS